MEASLLNKEDKGLVATSSANIGKDKLQNVTKHMRNVQVAQVEFEHDATVLCSPAAILMKGSDPQRHCTQGSYTIAIAVGMTRTHKIAENAQLFEIHFFEIHLFEI